MSLRKKTLLLFSLTLVLTLITGGFVAQNFFLDGYLNLEQQDMQADINRLRHAIDLELSNLDTLTYDWASWDDTYQFMQDRNSEYISSNLHVTTLENLGLNFMIFFSNEKNIFYLVTCHADHDSFIPTQAELEQHFIDHSEQIITDDLQPGKAGIITIRGYPYLVSSHPILTSQDEGPARGCLMFGKLLNENKLNSLRTITGQNITIFPVSESNLTKNQLQELEGMPPNQNALIHIDNTNEIKASILVRDLDNQPAYIFQIQKSRELFNQGKQGLLRLGVSLAASGIIAAFMALFILNRDVISRLFALNTAVQNIQTNGYHGQTLVIPGSDEISNLSIEIENAFNELANAQKDISKYLDVERTLFRLSTEFINIPIPKINDHIDTSLKTIGELSGADRSYVFLRRDDHPHIFDNTHEWCRKGIKPMKETLQGIAEPSLSWWFNQLRQGKTIIIPDVGKLPDSAKPERELLQSQSILSLVSIPMFAGGHLMGFVGYDAVRHAKVFSERSISLLGIMSSMIANAIGRKEREQRLSQSQQAQYKLNKLTLVSIEKNNLHSAALALSSKMKGLILSDKGILALFSSGHQVDIYDSGKHVVLQQKNQDELISFIRSKGEYIYIYSGGEELELPSFLKLRRVQAFILIPLSSRREILGAAILADKSPRAYTHEEAAICQQAGPQITLSIMKTRALESVRRRSMEMDALRATITDITSELQLDRLLRTALERAIKLANADAGEVSVFDEEKQALRVVASLNLDKDYTGSWMSVGEGAGGKAVELKKTFIVKDYATWPGRMHAYDGAKFHATIVSPLMIGHRVLGTISILHFDVQRQFSKNDKYILSLFAQHAAIALDNALLFEKVQELARTDALTGLFNRRALREIGEEEVERAHRLAVPIAVAMIDLDNFKRINDIHSHLVGDEVLKGVAHLLRENIRNIDSISRYGGDEFVIVMPATNLDNALQAAKRLMQKLNSTPILVDGMQFTINASLGLTAHAEDPPNFDELLQQADKAMYNVKNSGKNQIGLYHVQRNEP